MTGVVDLWIFHFSTIRSGPAPGSVFSEGVTTISYTARDSSGNSASCSFRVHITGKLYHRHLSQ